MTRYKRHVEGDNGWTEWIYPNRRKYKLACCDCGLVHNMQFKLVQRGLGKAILMRAQRNVRATAAMRRGDKNG